MNYDLAIIGGGAAGMAGAAFVPLPPFWPLRTVCAPL